MSNFYTRLVRPTLPVLIAGAILLCMVNGVPAQAPEPPVEEVMETKPQPKKAPELVTLQVTTEEPEAPEAPLEVVLLTYTVEEPEPVALVVEEPAPVAPVVEEPEPVEPEPTYTDEELELLALVIYQEAGSDICSDDTRLKVGTVVMNRVADSRFPGSIYEVVTERAQYGRLYWTGAVWPERASYPGEAHAVDRAYDCAERILHGERFLPEDVVFQAEFTQGSEVVAAQDGFYFCR